MKDKVLCPYCGAEMVFEGETIEDVLGSILLLGGWCLCEKCGSRSPYVNAADDAQLEERALSAAMQRYVTPNRVLTLEEMRAQEAPNAAWVEHKMNGRTRIELKVVCDIGEAVTHCDSGYGYWTEEYGRYWRAWLRRPTDEERQSVAWEEGERE